MKRPVRERLFLEQLEDRCCPALNITNAGGQLFITGTPTSGSLSITATGTPNQFSVMDVSTLTVSNVTSINVSLGGTVGGNSITVNLAAGHLLGTLTLDGGASLAANSLLLIGEGTAAKDVLGNASFSRLDSVRVLDADFGAGLTVNNGTRSMAAMIILADDTVGGAGSITGGSAGDTVGLAATTFNSSLNVSLGAGPNSYTDDDLCLVGTNFTYNGTTGDQTVSLNATILGFASVGMGLGDNVLDFTGFVGKTFSITGANGSNTIGGSAFSGTVNGSLTFNLGNGINSVDFSATVLGNVTYVGGSGSNSLTIDTGATVPASSRFTVVMGPGSNSLTSIVAIDAQFILFIQ